MQFKMSNFSANLKRSGFAPDRMISSNDQKQRRVSATMRSNVFLLLIQENNRAVITISRIKLKRILFMSSVVNKPKFHINQSGRKVHFLGLERTSCLTLRVRNFAILDFGLFKRPGE